MIHFVMIDLLIHLLELLQAAQFPRRLQMLPHDRPRNLGDINIAARIERNSVRRNELSRRFAALEVAETRQTIPTCVVDVDPVSQVGTVLIYAHARTELADPRRRLGTAASDSLAKALAIVAELRGALDFSHCEDVPRNLDRLYDFVTQRITEANITRTAGPADDAARALRPMKEAWDDLVARGA